MDRIILDEDLSSDEPRNKKRPAFFPVLCILSLVGCAAVLILFAILYVVVGGESKDSSQWPYLQLYFSLNMAGALAAAAGVVLMLIRKRSGYFIYLAGQLAPVIYGAIYYKNLDFDKWEPALVFLGIPLIFPVIYTFSYRFIAYGSART